MKLYVFVHTGYSLSLIYIYLSVYVHIPIYINMIKIINADTSHLELQYNTNWHHLAESPEKIVYIKHTQM